MTGIPIRSKPHTSPLDGTEAVPLSPDGFATTAEIAALGTGGGGGWIYGDGSDGDLVLHDGDTWLPGNYHDVTIEDGATVRVGPAGSGLWPMFCGTGTFTIDGTLDLTGNDADGPTRGQSHLASSVGLGSGAAADESSGDPAINLAIALGLAFISAAGTPNGGAGGDGDAGSGGNPPPFVYFPKSLGPHSGHLFPETVINAPVGGCSGSGDDVNQGGAGGSGGDWAMLCFRHVVHGPNNLYLLKGGKGGDGGWDGATTGNGNCGGGGGGAGGYWVTLSDTVDDVPANITTIGNGPDGTGTGGDAGAGCGTGTDGSAGDDGFVIHLLND